jgi:hypothetical protein
VVVTMPRRTRPHPRNTSRSATPTPPSSIWRR